MDLLPFLLLPFYIIFVLVCVFVFGELYYKHQPIKKYLLPAIGIKVFGALTFAFVYSVYYGGGGDTFAYFRGATMVQDALLYDFFYGIELLNTGKGTRHLAVHETLMGYKYFYIQSTWLIVKITAIFGLLGLKNYLLTTVCYSFFTFWGQWAMFRTFTKIFPKYINSAFLATFCVPSVVFWCGGILKDTIILSAVGIFFYCIYAIFFEQKKYLLTLPMLLLSLWVMNVVKFYVPLALLPAIFAWLLVAFIQKIENPYFKSSIIMGGLMGGVFLVFFSYYFFSNILNDVVLSLGKKAIATQTWHSYLHQNAGGSGYDLGTFDFTIIGFISKFPASINVTFFRPYLWEISSAVVFVAAVESLFVVFLTIFTILKIGFFSCIKRIFNHSGLLFFFIFCMLFGFLVGFTSYNFGALVRYKTPCLPFFFMLLFVLLQNKKMGQNIYEN